jgi:hypothetical protein
MERKSHKRKCLTVAALLFTSPALAESTMFFNSNGAYQGNASTMGSTTTYYGPSGQYLGTATSTGDSSSYYNSNGGYEGNSYGPSIAAPYGE